MNGCATDGFVPRKMTGPVCVYSRGTVLTASFTLGFSDSFWRSASFARQTASSFGPLIVNNVITALSGFMANWWLTGSVLFWRHLWTSSFESHCLCCSFREWRSAVWSAWATSKTAWRLLRRWGFSRLCCSIMSGERTRCSPTWRLNKA